MGTQNALSLFHRMNFFAGTLDSRLGAPRLCLDSQCIVRLTPLGVLPTAACPWDRRMATMATSSWTPCSTTARASWRHTLSAPSALTTPANPFHAFVETLSPAFNQTVGVQHHHSSFGKRHDGR